MELEDLGEQLYNLLAQVLNRPENRAFFDSIKVSMVFYGICSQKKRLSVRGN
ncbi:MAG: hypothetical protein ACLTAS_07315 [Butyribacter sp.]